MAADCGFNTPGKKEYVTPDLCLPVDVKFSAVVFH